MITITLEKEQISCSQGTTLYELSQKYQKNYEFPIIVAKCDGIIQELYHEVVEGTHVEFCTTRDTDGARVYLRGISMLLLKAIYKEVPKEELERVRIEFCLDTGYFCRMEGQAVMTQELLERIEKRMRDYVEEDILFKKHVIPTRDARQLFDSLHMCDKGQLMEYRRNSRTTVYTLGKFTDYYYGAMPYSTSILQHFRLELFEDGFVFVVPKEEEPVTMPEFKPSMKQYRALQYTNEWSRKLHVATVGQLNHQIVNGDFQDLMLTQEALHEKKIGDIAEQIAESGCRIVTIAGPSSSGKTTFSYRLSTQLKTLGLRPYPIGLDDYFVNRVDTPKDADGKYNYECIEAIDTRQFNQDLNDLLEGKEVQLPTYNFITGCREYDKPYIQLEAEDILVIEGIHGLNDKLTYSIPREEKFKIYISPLTTLNIDGHNRIPTTEGRLLRRIIRDARTRGNSARKTISMWNSVRSGENVNIFPFQEQADAMFNSALIYELAAMKLYADPLLFQVTKDCPEYAEAQRLLKFLDYFIPVDPHDVPLNSILREFIGGGILLG
ncbi:MAG: nucleoside kinase [Lachnospiraceae bacterium]|nr:nucleoside kinase [Lachnospiraceae bacterium]